MPVETALTGEGVAPLDFARSIPTRKRLIESAGCGFSVTDLLSRPCSAQARFTGRVFRLRADGGAHGGGRV